MFKRLTTNGLKYGILRLTTNKSFEWQFDFTNNGFELFFLANTRSDHAGLKFAIGIPKFSLHLSFYDHRHWDYKNNCWKVYSEKDED